MSDLSPRDYLGMKGWEFKEAGGQLVVKVCPKCGDEKGHFYVDAAEGAFFCHKCNERGNLITLQRDLGDLDRKEFRKVAANPPRPKAPPVALTDVDLYHSAFLSSPEAQAYMTGRGFTLDTCKAYRIGFKPGWVGLPTFKDGKAIVIKWRSLPPAEKKFMREPAGAESLLFNGDCLKSSPKEVIVAEGEMDALAAIQAGFPNVVGIPTGASSLPEECVVPLKKIRKVFLVYDPDPAGARGAEAAARRIGASKCYRVDMPGMDVNDFFKAGNTADAFRQLLAEAEPFEEPWVLTYDDVFLERAKRQAAGEQAGLRIGFRPLADLIGVFRPGNVYILAAYPKIGKTIMAMNLTWDLARRGIRCLFFCAEMSPEEVAAPLLRHAFRTDTLTEEHWSRGLGEVSTSGFLFGRNRYGLGRSALLEQIREEVHVRGVQFLVIDNFHFLTRGAKDTTAEEAAASMDIKMLAADLKIPVLLVVHPRKADREERTPTFQDLRGSAALGADASAVIVLHRPLIESEGQEEADATRRPLGFLRVDAHRFGSGGLRRVFFDTVTFTFREPTAEEITERAPKPKGQRRAYRYRGNAGADLAAGEGRS
jgi:5S rRNA maturation endonuclease (ribonuclease M5)